MYVSAELGSYQRLRGWKDQVYMCVWCAVCVYVFICVWTLMHVSTLIHVHFPMEAEVEVNVLLDHFL